MERNNYSRILYFEKFQSRSEQATCMICKTIHSAFNECQITFFFITNCSPNHQGATTRLAFAEIFFFGSQIVPIISKTIRTIKVGLFLVGKNDFAPLMVTLQMFISKIASGFDVRFCQLRLALHFLYSSRLGSFRIC